MRSLCSLPATNSFKHELIDKVLHEQKYITYLIGYTLKTEVDAIERLAKVHISKTGPAMAGPVGLDATPLPAERDLELLEKL